MREDPQQVPPGGTSRLTGWLAAVLAAGLLLRLAILGATADLNAKIVDEQHYLQLAGSILHGDGFAWAPGKPTSIRPPLYPVFVAGLWWVTGSESLQWIRAAQIVLSLLNVLLVYRLGLLLYDRRIALLGAALCCFYPTLVFFDYLILTEVLFTFLLTLFALGFVHVVRGGSGAMAFATGGVLGLASLARSILWPFPIVLLPFLFAAARGTVRRRLALACLLLAGHVAVLAPWSIRNTQLQRVFTVVDTMGGINLRCGNYQYTPLDRMWDAISLTGEKSWSHELQLEHPEASTWTEGQKERWARQKAVAFMVEHPLLTVERSLVRFADFWGLERVFLGGLRQGMYQLPLWLAALGAGSILLSYSAVVMLAGLGIFLSQPRDRAAHAFLLGLILFICGVHTIIFGHSRYNLPLVPFLGLYAAATVETRGWRRLKQRSSSAVGALATMSVLAIIWARELWIELPTRVSSLFARLLS